MFNCLVMNMERNLIINAYQGVSDEAITRIKRQYHHSAFKVMLVCSTVFSKWELLDRRTNGHVSINRLLRISTAYRDAIKHISKSKRKRNYNEDDNAVEHYALERSTGRL